MGCYMSCRLLDTCTCVYVCVCVHIWVSSELPGSSRWAAGRQLPHWGAVLDKGGHSPSSEFLLRRCHVRWERGMRGVGGAGAVEAATRRWEDSARGGRGLGSPRPPRGGAQAPRLGDRALLEAPPAPPRRGPLAVPPGLPGRLPGPRPPPPSPALRGLPQSQAAEQRRAPRYRVRAGVGPGTPRPRGRCCCSCPGGPAGHPPARRRGP